MISATAGSSRARTSSLNGITCPPLRFASAAEHRCDTANDVYGALIGSPVDPTNDRIDTGDGLDAVRDHPPFAERGQRLQVVERRVTQVCPVRPGAAVGDDVAAQLALGRLD